jgi:hypothetical protein
MRAPFEAASAYLPIRAFTHPAAQSCSHRTYLYFKRWSLCGVDGLPGLPIMQALPFLLLLLLGPQEVAAVDPCASATNCSDCNSRINQGCSWCQPSAVIYSNGTVGNRCAWEKDPDKWFCLGKSGCTCERGYICSGAPDYICQLSSIPGEGTPDKRACTDGCIATA